MTGVAKGCTDGLRCRRWHRLDPELDRGVDKAREPRVAATQGLHREVLDRRRRRRHLASIIRDDGAPAVASGQEDVAVAVGASVGGGGAVERALQREREQRHAITEVAQAGGELRGLGVEQRRARELQRRAVRAAEHLRRQLPHVAFQDEERGAAARLRQSSTGCQVTEGQAVVEIESDTHAAPRRRGSRRATRRRGRRRAA